MEGLATTTRYLRLTKSQVYGGHTEMSIDSYLDWLGAARNAAPGSVRTYRNTLTALPRTLDLDAAELEAFLRRPPLRAPSTRVKEAAILRGYFGWCHRRGLIASDPTIDLAVPKAPHRQPRPVGDEVWLRHWTAELPTRARLIMGLGMFAGLRRAEIARLRPDHVQRRPLMLVAFVRKGGGDHTLPLGDLLELWARRMPHLRPELFLPALEARLAGGLPLAWDRLSQAELDPSALNQYLRTTLGRDITPHALRHGFCTNAIRAGLPLAMVQKLANHSSPSTTSGYIQVGGGELREWLQ